MEIAPRNKEKGINKLYINIQVSHEKKILGHVLHVKIKKIFHINMGYEMLRFSCVTSF